MSSSSSTVAIAAAAHTTLSNALTSPDASTVHDPAGLVFPESVVISRPEEFAAKRAAMVAAGADKLQVIADFDRTISAFRCSSGELCHASHQLLESCVGFDHADFAPKMDAINAKYFALEVDPYLTAEARAGYMLEWWHQAHELLLQQSIRKQAIDDAVARARASGRLELRRGATELLHQLSNLQVPCLIFSAGLRETIAATLRAEQLAELPGHALIGNDMKFDDTGLLVAFGDDTITSSNKNYSHVHSMEPAFHAAAVARRNVILLGDNLGDADMAQGMEDIQCILRIGLLHDHVQERMEQFKAAFDVVLLNDAPMDFVRELVEAIAAGGKAPAATLSSKQ